MLANYVSGAADTLSVAGSEPSALGAADMRDEVRGATVDLHRDTGLFSDFTRNIGSLIEIQSISLYM